MINKIGFNPTFTGFVKFDNAVTEKGKPYNLSINSKYVSSVSDLGNRVEITLNNGKTFLLKNNKSFVNFYNVVMNAFISAESHIYKDGIKFDNNIDFDTFSKNHL